MTFWANRILTITLSIGLLTLPSLAAPVPATPSEADLKADALKLNNLTDTDAMQARLTSILQDKVTAKKLVEVADAMQKDAEKSPFKFNAALILAKTAHNVKNYEAAERFYEFCADNATKLQSGSKMLLAFEGLMDLYSEQKKYNTLEQLCRKLIDLKEGGKEFDQAKPFILEKMVQSKAKQGDTDEALRITEGLVNLDKGGWYFLQLKGWVQREAGDLTASVKTYQDVIEKLDDATGLKDDMRTRLKRNIRYMITGIYVEENKIDLAVTELEKLIKDDPENPTYYNDLGFILVDNNRKIDESEKLIKKAIELDAKQRKKLLAEGKLTETEAGQENAAYLDSLGWVYFKQKNYKEAVKYLEKAAQDPDEGAHLEIWDHWADALMKLGKTQEAVDVWKKSLRFEDVGKKDASRRRQITEKMNEAKATLKK